MSYTMRLVKDGAVCQTDRHMEGGVVRIGGTTDCEMHITGNYSRVWPIRSIAAKTGAETAPSLIAASVELGTDRDDDYWAWTPGNVGYTLAILGSWAMDHPDATWEMIG